MAGGDWTRGNNAIAWLSPGTNGGDNGLGVKATSVTYYKANGIESATASSTGYFIGTSLTDNKLYKNGVLLGTASIPAGATMSNGYKGTNYYGSGGVPYINFGAGWAGAGGYSNIKQSFSTFGYGLTPTEAIQLNTIVATYQQALGRLV